MGIREVIGMVLLRGVAAGVANVCAVGASAAANPIAKEAWKQGAQIATQVSQAAGKGAYWAAGELAKQQAYDFTVITDENLAAAYLTALPLPTP